MSNQFANEGIAPYVITSEQRVSDERLAELIQHYKEAQASCCGCDYDTEVSSALRELQRVREPGMAVALEAGALALDAFSERHYDPNCKAEAAALRRLAEKMR